MGRNGGGMGHNGGTTEAWRSTAQGGFFSNPTTNTRTQQLKMNTVFHDKTNTYKDNYKCNNYKYMK